MNGVNNLAAVLGLPDQLHTVERHVGQLVDDAHKECRRIDYRVTPLPGEGATPGHEPPRRAGEQRMSPGSALEALQLQLLERWSSLLLDRDGGVARPSRLVGDCDLGRTQAQDLEGRTAGPPQCPRPQLRVGWAVDRAG